MPEENVLPEKYFLYLTGKEAAREAVRSGRILGEVGSGHYLISIFEDKRKTIIHVSAMTDYTIFDSYRELRDFIELLYPINISRLPRLSYGGK